MSTDERPEVATMSSSSGWEQTEDAILWRELNAIEQEIGRRRLGWPGGRPPEQLLEFVAWKLQISPQSFYGRVLHLIPHADRHNLAALRQAFPVLVTAWEAWQESDGDFELDPAMVRFVGGGDVR